MCFRARRLTISPCKGCEDRVVGCHGGCERYKDFREQNCADYMARVHAYYHAAATDAYVSAMKRKTFEEIRRKGKWLT